MRLDHLGFAPDLVDYQQAWDYQRAVHARVVAGQQSDTILLLEHAAVFTAGKRTLPLERPIDGTPVIDVDRGGKITWHGPGQLVGYPIRQPVCGRRKPGPNPAKPASFSAVNATRQTSRTTKSAANLLPRSAR